MKRVKSAKRATAAAKKKLRVDIRHWYMGDWADMLTPTEEAARAIAVEGVKTLTEEFWESFSVQVLNRFQTKEADTARFEVSYDWPGPKSFQYYFTPTDDQVRAFATSVLETFFESVSGWTNTELTADGLIFHSVEDTADLPYSKRRARVRELSIDVPLKMEHLSLPNKSLAEDRKIAAAWRAHLDTETALSEEHFADGP